MGNKIELSTLIGIALAFILVLLAVSSGDGKVLSFLDLRSFLIVIGGTFFITAACFSIKDTFRTFGTVGKTMFFISENHSQTSRNCLKIAEIVRKKGLLELQNHSSRFPSSKFFERYIHLVIDGVPAKEVEKLMENEINSIYDRHEKSVQILRKAAEIAPAMGLIGTLIGLVQMLGNLEDPSKIGPAMAIALLTTMYGAVTAYMVLLPLASKLERNTSKEIELLNIYAEAILSIAKNEGPMKLEIKLNSILPPQHQVYKYSV